MKKYILIFLGAFLFTVVKSQSLTANPNPFVERTLLSYTLSSANTVSVEVYNQWGQNVITVKNGVLLSAGLYQDSLIMDGMAQGIYFVAIRTGSTVLANCKIIKTAATGIQVHALSGESVIYPNPSDSKIHIDLGAFKSGANITLLDQLGKVVYTTSTSTNQFDLDITPFAQGNYFLILLDDTQKKTYKIIKE